MIKVAILGYGNIGKAAEQAIMQAPDMELVGIFHHNDSIDSIQADVVLISTPTREVQHFAQSLLRRGISTIDSFDIHTEIYSHMQVLKPIAMQHQAYCYAASSSQHHFGGLGPWYRLTHTRHHARYDTRGTNLY